MANLRQLRSLIPDLSAWATGALAWAIMVALTVVAGQAVQAQTYHVIHYFTGGLDGASPTAGLTIDGAGNLYGTANLGGVGYGTVYKLLHKGSGWVFNPLFSFAGGSDGFYPAAGVIFGPDGSLYGTTRVGGNLTCDIPYGCGTVLKLSPPPRACPSVLCPWTKTALYQFGGPPDGAYPGYGDLIFDPADRVYGTTLGGGSNYDGTVYELTRSGSGWTERVLYAFSGPDGAGPFEGITLDNAGNLYSTTVGGGGSCNYGAGCGTVFQLTPSGSGWTERLLYSFQNGSDGSAPRAGLIFDQEGNMYGATSNGGLYGGGTVFELSLSEGGWIYTLLYSFAGEANCGPAANLVMDVAGNLYGTTNCDGANHQGSVFKLTPSSPYWTYTSLHDFTLSSGAFPTSNVIFDVAGNLYGTTDQGGNSNSNCESLGCGVVWQITP